MRYEARLRFALEESTLDLAFEPQLDLKSGHIGGLATELRWTDQELGKISEARTMETAEQSGLVREVTWWVFNNALRQSAEFAKAGLQVPISLKIAATGLLLPEFSEFMGRALRTWGVSPNRVLVEIHESALTGPLEQIKEIMGRLKSHGLRLGIDGFGTAASSLGNLAQLPFDEMKLAGAFVTGMRKDPLHGKIARSVVHLAKDLGLRLTAEGVADAETALQLSTLGCERIQGEYVSPPLAAKEIVEFASKLAGLSLRPQG